MSHVNVHDAIYDKVGLSMLRIVLVWRRLYAYNLRGRRASSAEIQKGKREAAIG